MALEHELFFITELVLENATINNQIIVLMLDKDQKKKLIDLIFKSNRPQFYQDNY